MALRNKHMRLLRRVVYQLKRRLGRRRRRKPVVLGRGSSWSPTADAAAAYARMYGTVADNRLVAGGNGRTRHAHRLCPGGCGGGVHATGCGTHSPKRCGGNARDAVGHMRKVADFAHDKFLERVGQALDGDATAIRVLRVAVANGMVLPQVLKADYGLDLDDDC